MATTLMSLKTDKRIKEKAQKIAKSMGFSLGTLLNAFLRQFIREKEISFSAVRREKLRPEIERILEEAGQDLRWGKNISPAFENANDAIAYLKKAV
jgi:addiction module RelB/DinJ family antitoxin